MGLWSSPLSAQSNNDQFDQEVDDANQNQETNSESENFDEMNLEMMQSSSNLNDEGNNRNQSIPNRNVAIPLNRINRIESLPSPPKPVAAESIPRFPTKQLSLEFSQARLANVFAALAIEGGVNFVFPDTIGNRRVSFRLNALPYDQAVKAITQTEGLRMLEVAPGVIRVDSSTNLVAQAEVAKQEERIAQVTQTVQMVRLNHARAKDVLPAISQLLSREGGSASDPNKATLPEDVKLAIDERTNAIILEAPQNVAQKVVAIIERLDVSTPQAEIATRIVELQKSAAKFIGVNWDGGLNFNGGRGLGFGSLDFPNSVTAPFAVDTGTPPSQVGDFRFRIGSITDALDLDLRLKLQESEGRAEILQSGKVIVQDGGTAKIAAGTTLYVRPVQLLGVAGDASAGALSEVKLQLTLEVGASGDERGSPRGITISKDGIVRIPVKLTSAIPQSGSEAAIVSANSRELRTEVVKKSGETAVIGGIFNTSTRKVVTGVPGLSKIPIIGALFRSNNEVQEQTELLIMMTPRVVDPLENSDPALNRFDVSSRSSEGEEQSNSFPSNGLQGSYKKSRKHLGL
jgi:type IV pilus assembly protein PilQ